MFPSLIPMVFSGTFFIQTCLMFIDHPDYPDLPALPNQVKIAAALLKLQITLARDPEAIFKTERPA